jgi:hypothetical protein
MVHTLRLDNYFPTPRKLVLGTNSSFGTESIKIERGAGWDGLNLTATWHIPGREEPLRVALLDGDAMDVPPEVTKKAKDGVLVLAGLASGVQRASCNVEYLILEQAGVYGGADAEPTPELAAQVLEAALQAKADAKAAAEDAAAAKANADKAQADAEKAQQAAENAAADAAKAGPYAEAARAAKEAAESARDEAIAAQQAAENAAAAAAASKSAADTLATEAAQAAQAAENSKAAANNAANLAGENATAAQQAADTATAAANDAGQSASDAAARKAAAETAAKAAQDAQTAAAAAKAEAVNAQGAAQTAAKSAQDAQAAAEKARDEAKTAQEGAEAARDTAAKSAEAAAKSEANAKQSADTLAESVENVAANTAAVAELKEKKAEIDDTAVGANSWSSKNIVDMICPPIEEISNPVVCYPVAGYPLGVKAKWEPVQEGSGTPSPENIRPIKGRDSVTVERCGENLVKFPYYTSSYNKNGLVFTAKQDGSITVDGTATANTFYVLNYGLDKRLPMNTPMTLSGCPAGGTLKSYYIGLYIGGKWFTDVGDGNTNVKLTTRKIDSRVEVSIAKGVVCNSLTFYPKIEVGTTITLYSKYQGSTNTMTLPETVYGGEVDAVTGKGQETWQLLNNPSSYNYYEGMDEGGWVQSEDAVAWYLYNPTLFSRNTKTLSNIFNFVSDIGHTAKPYLIGSANHLIAFRLPRSVAATGTDVKNWLASNNVEIAFETITQTPFTATGAQPIPAIAGVNTVLTDADSVTVMGRADPIKRITDLEDAVASQT